MQTDEAFSKRSRLFIAPTGTEAPEPRCSQGQRGQLCPFLIAIELFYHPNNLASNVRNVTNELIVVGRHWSF